MLVEKTRGVFAETVVEGTQFSRVRSVCAKLEDTTRFCDFVACQEGIIVCSEKKLVGFSESNPWNSGWSITFSHSLSLEKLFQFR